MVPRVLAPVLVAAILAPISLYAQQSLGTLAGTVTDQTGAIVPAAAIQITDDQTAATRDTVSDGSGSYSFQALPIGSYRVRVQVPGFNTEQLQGINIQADRTATLNLRLRPGEVSTSVDVTATPQMNATDMTNGYVLDAATIESIPLGTGSFTQLATLSPGVQADLLADTGTNTGLGNQNIYANGQRLTSNTFTMNSVMSNNLFNGASSSQVAESRAVLNTGESFQTNGTIRTNTSIFDAIGRRCHRRRSRPSAKSASIRRCSTRRRARPPAPTLM